MVRSVIITETDIIYNGDFLEVLKTFPDKSINCCVTSPPYFNLRDYGVPGQIGLEETPEEYINKLVEGFREVKRVLKDDGTLWINIGDSYSGSGKGIKAKDLIGIPWMLAFALRADGWYLRQDIIWNKPNPMPESVTDRCTKAHEYIFLLSKSQKYYFNAESIKEPTVYPTGTRTDKKRGEFKGKYHVHEEFKHISDSFRAIRDYRNKRDVWTVSTKPYRGAHFATFPEELIEPCILAGCPAEGIVVDPFIGSGTTGRVAKRNGREFIGIELNPDYIKLATQRINEPFHRVEEQVPGQMELEEVLNQFNG
jgi:DNA modification methylase